MEREKTISQQLEGGHINTVYREDGYVVKEYKEHVGITTPPRIRFEREVSSLRRFGGIIAPRLLSFDEERLTLSMEYIHGQNLRYIMENGTHTDERMLFVKKAAEFAQTLHSDTIPIGIQEKSDYIDTKRRTALTNIHSLVRSGIAQESNLNTDLLLRHIIRHDIPTITRAVHNTHTFSFLHGDFWFSNIMGNVETGELTGILDWEYAHYGMRQEDLAQTMMWDFINHKEYISHFFENYGAIEGVESFVVTTALEYASETTLEDYREESETGFTKTHIRILQEVLS